MLIEAYAARVEEEAKQKFAYIYNNAALTAIFVCKGLNGDKIPTISEVYPDMFKAEVDVEKTLQIYKEQFIDFANAHNKKLKRGE